MARAGTGLTRNASVRWWYGRAAGRVHPEQAPSSEARAPSRLKPTEDPPGEGTGDQWVPYQTDTAALSTAPRPRRFVARVSLAADGRASRLTGGHEPTT
ncbi:MAG: hypothetical protein AVDCRST_MAG49-1047 [uncultured Thermomicrobiales bacterium]|uniref:Uncharacterized protein n=1 Tax=uncultured Thermomicrobiales bacterium TaxID=1645740 RepID=A0A6J4U7F9_9BACT|nr:MAG: hypothetical protein AVDCRST_MAG49-1047 [uncultured Thermomicrobiales bacterium]